MNATVRIFIQREDNSLVELAAGLRRMADELDEMTVRSVPILLNARHGLIQATAGIVTGVLYLNK